MANLVKQHAQYLSFDNSGNFTTAAFDTTGDTWCILCVSAFSGSTANVTAATYNGHSITGHRHDNAATAHNNAGQGGVYPFALGADAGSHTFNIQWTGGNFLDFIVVSGNGDLDSGVVDNGFADTDDVASAGVSTPTPFTPSSNNALPIIFYNVGGLVATISQGSNCTLDQKSSLDSGVAAFHCPLSTPAGTATSATINNTDTGFNLAITFALKPTASAGSVGATTGAGTAAATGASQFSGVGATSGVGTAAATGASTFAAVGSAAGIGSSAGTAAGTHTLTLTNNVTYFTGGNIYNFKRTIGGTTDVVVAGTYAGGTPTHIEYQLGGSGAYTTVNTESISGGNWSGKILSQSPGDQTLKIRWSNDTATNLTTLLSVGDNILVMGDSESTDPGTNNVTPSATPFHVRYQHNGIEWVDWDSTPEFQQGQWAYYGEQVTSGQSTPVFILNAGASGSSFANWASGQTDLNNAITLAATLFNGGITAVMMCNLGTNDARQSSTLTAAGVKTTIDSICTAIQAVLPGGSAPIFWTPIAQVDANIGGGTLRTEMDAVRGGLVLSVAGGSCHFGSFLQDLLYSGDNLHPDDNDLAPIGRRQYLETADTLYSTSLGSGPRVTAATIDATKTIVVVSLDRAISNALTSSVVGFQVSDSGAPVTINSQIVTTSTSITLTLATAIVGTCTVTWTSNNDATGQTVPLRPTETLPTGATVQRPIELIFNQATVPSGTAIGVAVGMSTASAFASASVAASLGIGSVSGVGASTAAAVGTASGHATVKGFSGGVTTAMVPQLRLRRAVLPM
jgi:hypothetical protein